MRIRIQSTNIYYKNTDPRGSLNAVRRNTRIMRADSIGIQEGGYPLHRGLKNYPGYHTRWKKDKNVNRRNNITLVRKAPRIKVLGQRWFHGADSAGTPTTPQRNIFVVRYEKRGVKIAHINTHFHVVREERLATQPPRKWGRPAKQYRRQVREVLRLMRMYRRRGFVVFVTMDGNTRPRAGVPDWKFASYNFLRRNHWKVIIAGIDHMVYDNSRVKLVRHEIVPQSKLGQADHPTILAAFDVRRFFVRKSRKARKRNNKK